MQPINLPDQRIDFVLPNDLASGFRGPNDRIWGLWPADNESTLIWQNMNSLIATYGLKLDIVYDGSGINYTREYSRVFLWNQTSA